MLAQVHVKLKQYVTELSVCLNGEEGDVTLSEILVVFQNRVHFPPQYHLRLLPTPHKPYVYLLTPPPSKISLLLNFAPLLRPVRGFKLLIDVLPRRVQASHLEKPTVRRLTVVLFGVSVKRQKSFFGLFSTFRYTRLVAIR